MIIILYCNMTQLSDIAYVEMQYELKYFYGFHEHSPKFDINFLKTPFVVSGKRIRVAITRNAF